VTHTRRDGAGITPEERAARKARIEAAEKRPVTFDQDCPKLTPEQLAEFRSANFTTREERAEAMRAVGVTEQEQPPVLEAASNK
ncbi:MAG: hypothetical protein LBJ24_04835, partial [Treponema sp.]|nr:hypothetical protein [Treponema sp.]